MEKAQYAIMRFAKYKGPEIGRIEAHDERTKEKYASNPDVDASKSHLNFHLITPPDGYRSEAERQIAEAGCRVRTDSVRLVEVLIAGSPEFFEGKSPKQIREYFRHALTFLQQHQKPETFVSAVVHMDEKTPHMHVTFVPLTQDGRLSAKEIIGNRKRLVQWQDDYWKHMVGKYPELERGESASETGRDHIPPRVFKEAVHLSKQAMKINEVLDGMTMLNAKKSSEKIVAMLRSFFPRMEKLQTQLKKYDAALKELKAENQQLKDRMASAASSSFDLKLENAKLKADLENVQRLVSRIPPEIVEQAKHFRLTPSKEVTY